MLNMSYFSSHLAKGFGYCLLQQDLLNLHCHSFYRHWIV